MTIKVKYVPVNPYYPFVMTTKRRANKLWVEKYFKPNGCSVMSITITYIPSTYPLGTTDGQTYTIVPRA